MKSPLVKPLLVTAALLLSAATAPGTVTLVFSTTNTYASNWANGAGEAGQQLIWGIIVDAGANGFGGTSGMYSPTGVSFATAGSYQSLRDFGTDEVLDDLLFLSPNPMTLTTNTNDGGSVGLNRITAIANVPLTNGANTGDIFRIVWFDRTALSGSPVLAEAFGIFESAAFVLPADSATVSYSAVFAGADPLKQMTNQFGFPEPSTLTLSLLGALGLLRRRR